MEEKKEPKSYVMLKLDSRSNIIISEFVKDDGPEVILRSPLMLTFVTKDDDVCVQASKFFPFSQDEIVAIQKDSIVALASPKQTMIAYYRDYMKEYSAYINDEMEEEVLGFKQRSGEEEAERQTELLSSYDPAGHATRH